MGNETVPKASKQYETYENMTLGSNGLHREHSLRKIPTRFRGTNICINCTIWAFFAPSYKRQRNCPKCTREYEMHQNMSFGSNGVDRERSLRKIPTRLRGMNLCINCTISARFAPSFVRQRNGPKCIQTIWNTPKHEFRVQCGGSGVLVAKNSDTTSWHELLH